MIGSTLSHFTITAKLGEGGMGEVYRAEDSKLGREVAIKVLPEAVASDPERLARFEREAKVLASLNHPNIAGIYQVEEAAGKVFLVMELVEGLTLADRIARGPIPLEQALSMALQIAEGLEAAHDRGIVHRDLKPANVKVTPEGAVKVLDFGLAKALDDEQPAADMANSPTLTAAATQAGIILGTAAYMSPEQAAGEAADRRSDIWSFGVVLAEMLTGKAQFQGKTVSHVLAAVLQKEAEWEEAGSELPHPIRELLRRCLHKEARHRLQAIGDARIVIEEYLADPQGFASSGEGVAVAAPAVAGPTWRRILPWALLVLTAAGLVAALWRSLGSEAPAGGPTRAMLRVPPGKDLDRGFGSSVVLSPDGKSIAYCFGLGESSEIQIQALDQWEGVGLVSGAGNAQPYQPFFSPDGLWLGFVTPSELKKVPVTGGTPISLCPVDRSRGATWTEDDFIVLAPNPSSGLFRVASAGGELEPLTELDEERGEATHRWPQALPGGDAVLFTSNTSGGQFDSAHLEVVTLKDRQRRVVHQGGYYGRYVASGHLIYVNQNTLFAIRFDLDRLETTGVSVPVVGDISGGGSNGGAQFSVSDDGRLAYLTGEVEEATYEILLVDRQGESVSLPIEPRFFGEPAISPDGTRVALSTRIDGNWDVWIADLERNVSSRFTFDEGEDVSPAWSPDGDWIVFSSERGGTPNLYRKAADGTGEAEPIAQSTASQYARAQSWSPDGSRIVYNEFPPDTRGDLWMVAADGSGEATPWLATPFMEIDPAFSPDGRWIAYASNESGSFEIFVRAAEGESGKWQISTDGGRFPQWSGDGKELFFWAGASSVHVAAVDTESKAFRADQPRPLFAGEFVSQDYPMYAVDRKSGRFILFGELQRDPDRPDEEVRLVLDWFSELEETFGKVGR